MIDFDKPYNPLDHYWLVQGGDETRLYSSAGRAWVGLDDPVYLTWKAGGGVFARVFSEDEIWEYLARIAPEGLPDEAVRRTIRKSIVQQRLIEAGKMDAAYGALTKMPSAFARWFAPDRPEVYADDPDALALLQAIGADAETIMAPE